jgi:hypothetical protein
LVYWGTIEAEGTAGQIIAGGTPGDHLTAPER